MNGQAFNESAYLSEKDIAVDDTYHPSMIQIRIKQSKTDPFQRGIDLFVGRTGAELCPVSAILDYMYLSVWGMSPDLLFKFNDG